jgi:hypothetical protein
MTWGTESGLVGCPRQVDEVIEGSFRIQPILAKAEVFGVESNLPRASEGLDFLCVSEGLEINEEKKQRQSQEAREIHEEIKS